MQSDSSLVRDSRFLQQVDRILEEEKAFLSRNRQSLVQRPTKNSHLALARYRALLVVSDNDSLPNYMFLVSLADRVDRILRS